jgi:hypothetical protein
VTRLGIDHAVFPASLWNGADFHVVSRTRFLRCWFSRPQLGGCLNHSKTRASTTTRINRSRLPGVYLAWNARVASRLADLKLRARSGQSR